MTQRILITGATRGIGRATAIELAAPGTTLVLTGRSTADRPDRRMPGTLEETAAEARGRGATVIGISADFADPEQVDAVAARVTAELGGVDVLINNAAISYLGAFLTVPPRRWATALQVDLLAPVALMHALVPGMVERGSGLVINLSSGAAREDIVPQLPYAVSKMGLERITTSAAAQLGDGVTLTALRIDEIVVTEAVRLSAPQLETPEAVRADEFAGAIRWVVEHPTGLHGQVLTMADLRRAGAVRAATG